jgi:uncharacterized protein (DUF2062 family)
MTVVSSTYEIGSTTYMTAAEQMDTITAYVLKDEIRHTEVNLLNGDSLTFVSTMTVGDAIVAASMFLLLAFLVLKWLLETVWRR